MRSCLAEGFPFVFGFTVYESFESQQVARTGVVLMPKSKEGVVGCHAVFIEVLHHQELLNVHLPFPENFK
jgi:hypothetical protein